MEIVAFTPADRASGVCLVLLAAAVAAGVVRRRAGQRQPWALLGVAALGAVMGMGAYLKWGEVPVMLGEGLVPLPFRWLGALHPALERLSWPERWGLLMPLGLAAFAARAPKPWLLAAALLLPLPRPPLLMLPLRCRCYRRHCCRRCYIRAGADGLLHCTQLGSGIDHWLRLQCRCGCGLCRYCC